MGAGVVIVGGGLAAQRCAEALRGRGYDDRIRIVGEEPERPYDRPPLSKGLLAGASNEADVAFRAAEWYEENDVELLLGRRAEGLDPDRRIVRLEGDGELEYDKALIATGAYARRLSFLDGYDNVHALRNLADLRALRGDLRRGSRLAVIGAGFIGQEVAATARGLGLEVTILEAQELPLAAILGPKVGRWFAELHVDEGVRLLLEARLEGVSGDDRAEELVLADGRRIACDAVVVGVGVAPNTGWLAGGALGPMLDDAGGVHTDTAARTRVPDVFAAGDAASPFDPRTGMYARTEHWDAAARQGAAAAQAMLGAYPGTPPLPSFWSDQYGVRIQYVGHAGRADGVLVEGNPADRDFTATYMQGGRPIAALAVGRPRAVPKLRRLIELGHTGADTEEIARAA